MGRTVQTQRHQQIRKLFRLDDRDTVDVPLVCQKFTASDADWHHFPQVPDDSQKSVRQAVKDALKLNPLPSAEETELLNALDALMDQPRKSCSYVYVVGRECVLDEMGGRFGGPVGNRIARALGEKHHSGYVYGEGCGGFALTTEQGQHILDIAAEAGDAVPRFNGVPIIFVRKGEESQALPYGDVVFEWPSGTPEEQAQQQLEIVQRQLAINNEICGGLFQAILNGGGSINVIQ